MHVVNLLRNAPKIRKLTICSERCLQFEENAHAAAHAMFKSRC